MKIINFISILSLFVMISACQSHFLVQHATHKTIIVNESSNNELITVLLKEVRDGVTFESLVYSKSKLAVQVEQDGDITKVTAIKQNGSPIIIGGKEAVEVDLADQLLYSYKGKQYHILLDDIEYLPSQSKSTK